MSTCPTCVFTVVSLTNRSAAISAFDRPRATSLRTSTSRSVSVWRVLGGCSSPEGRCPAYLSSSRRVTLGASIASPLATTRIACTSSCAGASLSRKPLAPARSASTTYSSRSKVVSTNTLTGPSRSGPVICRVASTPSIRGMRMSMSTTSGWSARTWSSACTPSPASPTTATSGSASRIIRKPVRSSGWSSTRRTRIATGSLLR
ncbi:hypothetical protein GA0115252_152712 [Streptomyces sp. DfronAA-171]|nr:hypothetical protein GA0115252_152712 [Streptomyces sp. DfronAA-171]